MVPEIKTPHSLKRALNYNEKKVEKDHAKLIHAGNFLQTPEELNFYQKMNRFEKLMELNQRPKTKAIHISLNFHPSEKEKLTKELLKEISDEYMNRIGFGNQPYLVYQHHDAGHPHVHIVSTTIQADGSRINTHNLGRNQSEQARKELEQIYGLVRADKGMHLELRQELERAAIHAERVQYGKSETRQSITNVLDTVINQYRYTSLPELNAILQQYNVLADRGNEQGRIYKNRGLMYRILDENGQKVGVPIKASLIYSKPTLNYLEKKFLENHLKREPDRSRLKTAIDWTLQKPQKSLEDFTKALEKERVLTVIRRNEQGRVYGLTYIDFQTKSVFNGSDLGKEYAAKRILERLGLEQNQELKRGLQQSLFPEPGLGLSRNRVEKRAGTSLGKTLAKNMELLFEPEEIKDRLPYELREEQKRKRKRQQSRDLER